MPKYRDGFKRLSRRKKKEIVMKLIEKDYTNDEIISEIAIGRDKITEFRKELKINNSKLQMEADLKTAKELEMVELVKKAEIVLPKVADVVAKVESIENKVCSLENLVEENVELTLQVENKALKYVSEAIDKKEIEVEKVAYLVMAKK
jgi:hypothetical protein